MTEEDKAGGEIGEEKKQAGKMPEKNKGVWVELTVTTTPEAGEMVSELLLEIGCQGVVFHDPRLYDSLQGEPVELRPAYAPESRSYRVDGYLALMPGWEEKLKYLTAKIEELRAFLPVGIRRSLFAKSKRKTGPSLGKNITDRSRSAFS